MGGVRGQGVAARGRGGVPGQVDHHGLVLLEGAGARAEPVGLGTRGRAGRAALLGPVRGLGAERGQRGLAQRGHVALVADRRAGPWRGEPVPRDHGRHRRITPELFAKYRRRYTPYGSVASLYLWEVAGGAIPGMKDWAPKSEKR